MNREEAVIAAKVFVGNLSYDTKQSDLQSVFSQVGQVIEVFLPVDRSTGRPRGFALVEMGSSAEVAKAIQQLDGHEVQGRSIRVSEARERAARPAFGAGPPGGGGGGDFWGTGGGGGGGGDFRGGKGGGGIPKAKGSRRNLRGRKRSL